MPQATQPTSDRCLPPRSADLFGREILHIFGGEILLIFGGEILLIFGGEILLIFGGEILLIADIAPGHTANF